MVLHLRHRWLNKSLESTRSFLGYLTKTLLLCSLLLLPTQTHASGFEITSSPQYSLNEDGQLNASITFSFHTDVTHQVVRFYTIAIPFVEISDYTVTHNGVELETSKHDQKYSTDFVIDLDTLLLTPNEPEDIILTFQIDQYVEPPVSSLSFPLQIDETTVESIEVKISDKYGKVRASSGDYHMSKSTDYNIITAKNPTKNILYILTGDTISYDFTISKSLLNETDKEKRFAMSMPVDNSYQLVTYNSITPSPTLSSIDLDGNIRLYYDVPANTNIDVDIVGNISHVTQQSTEELSVTMRPVLTTQEAYWNPSEDLIERFEAYHNDDLDEGTQITQLSTEQQDSLYASIYRFPILMLKVQQGDADTIQQRMSPDETLEGGSVSAINYADLQIALLRAYSIPSRLISGYITPVSGEFSTGFYHTWVEYWREGTGWTIMDSAYEEITTVKGHLNTLYDHVTLNVRGTSPLSPRLTSYEPTELLFEVAGTPSVSDLRYDFILTDTGNPDIYTTSYLLSSTLTNTGNVPLTKASLLLNNVPTHLIAADELVMPGQKLTQLVGLTDTSFYKPQYADGMTLEYSIGISSLHSQEDSSSGEITIVANSPWWWDAAFYTVSTLLFSFVFLLIYNGYRLVSLRFRNSRLYE